MLTRTEAAYCHRPPIRIAGEPRDQRASFFAHPFIEERLPVGLKVKVLPHGVFSFDFSEFKPELSIAEPDAKFNDSVDRIAGCTTVLNAHIVCLNSALWKMEHKILSAPMAVQTTDVYLVGYDQNGPRGGSQIDPESSVLTELWMEDKTVRNWEVEVSRDVLDKSFQLLNQILTDPADYLLKIVELSGKAWRARYEHDYVVALTLAWAADERLLQTMWDRYLQENREREIDGKAVTFINAERKERLKSRDYTASVVSEFLSMLGVLPLPLFEKFSAARKARNGWLHGLHTVTLADTNNATDAAYELMKIAHGIDLPLAALLRA